MSAIVDSELAEKLVEEIDQIVKDGTESLASGYSYEKYQQSCGFIEAMRQVRHALIPRILEELQKR